MAKNKRKKRSARVYRSRKQMTYHGRVGYPMVHTSDAGREFIMVRKKGGGTKKLFLVRGDVPAHLRD